MRVKTESKRQEVLDAAAVEFRDRGYHETTMTHVARRMGSSKATIYNYFSSKADLFGAMLVGAAWPAALAMFEAFDPALPFADRITGYARRYLRMNASAAAISLQRLMIANREITSAIMRPLRQNPELAFSPRLARIFREEQEKGGLRDGDVDEMAKQLQALLHGDLPMRMLFAEQETATEAEMDASADSAVRLFLAAYGAR